MVDMDNPTWTKKCNNCKFRKELAVNDEKDYQNIGQFICKRAMMFVGTNGKGELVVPSMPYCDEYRGHKLPEGLFKSGFMRFMGDDGR